MGPFYVKLYIIFQFLLTSKRSAVWTPSGSRYATVLSTSKLSVVCTQLSSRKTTEFLTSRRRGALYPVFVFATRRFCRRRSVCMPSGSCCAKILWTSKRSAVCTSSGFQCATVLSTSSRRVVCTP